jgi:predicted  nucleic acid-binding Zn-ribbon protein
MVSNQFEPFFLLKEFQSLDKHISECLTVIQEEEKRLIKLNQLKQSRAEDLENHLSDQEKLQKDIASKEIINSKLSRDYEQTLASETQIKTSQELQSYEQQKAKLENEKNKLDQELFELLEQQEELATVIKDDQSFLSGINKTIQDIAAEVNQVKIKEESSIKDYEYRQSLLLENLPTHFQDRFQRIYKNLKGKRPITIARGSNCAECAFLLSRNLLSELDRGETLVTCPNCHRLLLPSSATS